MSKVFLKDQNIETSPPVVGYQVLKYIKSKGGDKMSVFDLADHFKDEKWFSPKTLYYGMIFLFSVGLIDFHEPYVIPNATA